MSYRVYVNDNQIFGNNESYAKWEDYLKKQGVEIDEDGCYKGTITNFMEALSVIEEIVMDIESDTQERIKNFEEDVKLLKSKGESTDEMEPGDYPYWATSLFDLRPIYKNIIKYQNDTFPSSLFDELSNHISRGYLFLPIAFYKTCESKLEPDRHFADKKHFNCYKLKDGEVISVRAC